MVELACRPPVIAGELAQRCPQGLCVARLPRSARVDVLAPWAERTGTVSVRPPMPTMAGALLGTQIRAAGRLPWAATLCGFVALCADARGFVETAEGTIHVDLVPPGAWADGLEGRLLRTRPGRPWTVLEPGRAGLSARGAR